MFRTAASYLIHPVALALLFAVGLAGCNKDPRDSDEPDQPRDSTEQMRAHARLCKAGETSSCEHVAQQCAAAGDAECTVVALTEGCKQGSVASCEAMFAVVRESAKDCATQEACIESLGVVDELDKIARSPENDELRFASLDRLCHNFEHGQACAMAAEFLQAHGKPGEEVAEHIVLACRHGHEPSCQMVSQVAENMCEADSNPRACYVVASQQSDPRKAKRLYQWSCNQGFQPACVEARKRNVKVGAAGRASPSRRAAL